MSMPDFKSEEERRQWIIKEAHYFTVVRRIKRSYERHECPTLKAARRKAQSLVAKSNQPFMIYGVYESSDSWVENVMPKATPPVKETRNARGAAC